jgi:glycosyltransferase involved in cell wall biosynthesis
LDRPFFSIVLPTYNSGLTINKVLDSILNQSYGDFELIVVDGLSNDHTSRVVGEYKTTDSRVKFVSEADEGIYDAMNKGIKLADGKWIYFIGSDDSLFDRDVLKNVSQIISRYNDANVYYGNVVITGDTNWAYDGEVYDGLFNFQKLVTKNICHQSVFYETEFIKEEIGLFNKKYNICADWDLNLRCWSKTEFIYMDLKVANFIAGGKSTKYSADASFTEDLVPNILKYFNISPFNKLVNYPQFPQYGRLLEMQKKKSFPHYVLDRMKKKLINH